MASGSDTMAMAHWFYYSHGQNISFVRSEKYLAQHFDHHSPAVSDNERALDCTDAVEWRSCESSWWHSVTTNDAHVKVYIIIKSLLRSLLSNRENLLNIQFIFTTKWMGDRFVCHHSCHLSHSISTVRPHVWALSRYIQILIVRCFERNFDGCGLDSCFQPVTIFSGRFDLHSYTVDVRCWLPSCQSAISSVGILAEGVHVHDFPTDPHHYFGILNHPCCCIIHEHISVYRFFFWDKNG